MNQFAVSLSGGRPAADAEPGTGRTVLLPSLLLLVAMLNLTLVVAGLKELIIDELGGTLQDTSLFFSIEMLAYVIFAPLWGVLSDRWGRRKPLVVVGFAASALLYAAFTVIDSLPVLLLLRFLQGAMTVLGWSTLMAMVLDHPDDSRRGRHSGMMGGAISLGVCIGAPLGGYLSRYLGVRAPLATSAVLFTLLVGLAFLLYERPAIRRQTRLREIAGTLRRHPRLLLPFSFYFVDRFTVGFFVVFFPQFLAGLGADDPAVRGQYLGLFLLPFALLQPVTGWLAERTGPYAPLLLGSLLYGLSLAMVGYSGMASLWWIMLLLGALAAVMFPPAIMLTARLSPPEARGSAVGGFNLAGSLGFAAGPLAGGAVYAASGIGPAFVSAGLLEVLAVLVALVLMRRVGTG